MTDASEQGGHPGMPRGRTALFAIASGAAVGNLYWAQPLLVDISTSLHFSTAVAGFLVTMTQVGYGIGILLIVPLGDTLNRRRMIPALMFCSALPQRPTVPYGELLWSVFSVVRRHRVVQVSIVLGAVVFSVFTMFWTGLTFLLSAPPFSYSSTQIGLVGFAGLAGTLGARRAGRLHDQGWSMPATGAGLLLAFVALVIAAVGSTSIILVLIGVVLLDGAVQMVNVLNQTRLFSVDARARSRLNTAFVAGIYTGGAMGSALSGALWQFGGWRALMLCGTAVIGVGLIVWLTQRKVLAVR